MDELFWAKVEKTDSCWVWTGHKHHKGYGLLNRHGKVIKAHRYSYEMQKGKIPEGMQLDHLCRNRACVNPNHLEPVTNRENVLRGNTFLNKKTKLPPGVNAVGRRFRAQKRVGGLPTHIGYFDTPELAHKAYSEYGHAT